MKALALTYIIPATPERVMDALCDEEKISVWSGKPAEMNAFDGGTFSLWQGSIYGENIEITASRIVQSWQLEEWNEPSRVTINLKADNRGTEIEIIHENIPDRSYTPVEKGWLNFYITPLMQSLQSA
jgi:activator of HSP90 ATPase